MVGETTSTALLSQEEIDRLKDFKHKIRVRYSETDMSGHPHHPNYFIWLEEARMAFFRELGLSYRTMEEEGIFFPIVEERCRYLDSIHMDDMIEIHLRILKATRRFFKMGYTLTTQEENPREIAEAETMNIAVNAERSVISLPEKYLNVLKAVQQIQAAQGSG